MRSLLLVLLPLAACSPGTVNYAGTMRPLSGTCDPASEATLTLRKAKIIFAPSGGTIFLEGNLTGQTASATLVLTDPAKHPYNLDFQGTKIGDAINGTYTTPRCRYGVKLHLTQD